MLREIIAILLFLFLVPIFKFPAYAAEDPLTRSGQEFAASYDVIYDIDNSGVTTVTEKINLRNLTSEYYADQFKLIIGATRVSDIKAADGGGAMEVSSEQQDTSTKISVKFNQQVVGIDKVLSWTLQFKSKDFAEKSGKIWEVRAPKVSSTANLDSYNLTIAVPVQFGEPTIISPTPKSQTTSAGKMFLTFEKEKLMQAGVSASFGNIQLFDFDLGYHLENNNLVPVLTNIALPPDTAYQDVIYQRIEPKPLNVTVDDDGNYLAWYRLKSKEKLDIKAVGSAKLYTQSKVKNPLLNEQLRAKYTSKDKYWETDNLRLQSILSEILGSDESLDSTEKAKAVYHYVVNSLKYDPSRIKDNIERLGAANALNNPDSAVCMEFTDLFITLSRAAGIPTRELDGFAYTANPTLRPLSLTRDILHAWPEFWDEKRGWVMVDPTWENTTGGVDYFNKFDLNHFVFVIKGSSSQSPIPAGSYKYIGEDSHDVKVNLSENDFLGTPQLDVKIENSEPILAGFPGKIKVSVANVGNAIYPSKDFAVTSSQISILEGGNLKLGPVPPYGEAVFNLNIKTKGLFDTFDDQIEVLIGAKKFSKDVSVKPLLIFQTYPLAGVAIVSLMGLVYLIILGARIYRVRFAKKPK